MRTIKPPQTLQGIRILSLSLNLPGPSALLRCKAMGARCLKIEPPAIDGVTADPIWQYSPLAYRALHQGIVVKQANLKTPQGQSLLQRELRKIDVLLVSFRPSALTKLGLDWKTLHAQYPQLCMVSIVGALGQHADKAGHDLTYQAENGLITGLDLPATLLADMGGALMTCEAILQTLLLRQKKGDGVKLDVALSDAAAHLALPRTWELTTPGHVLSGQHAGYQVYACLDGRVALAALEPHFAERLCAVLQLPWQGISTMMKAQTRAALKKILGAMTCAQLEALALEHDLPLHTILKT